MTRVRVPLSRAAIFPVLLLLSFSVSATGGAITVGYLSFSSDQDGGNTQFSLRNISSVDFDNAELDIRYSTGGIGGDPGPHTLVAGTEHTVIPGGIFYLCGEAFGTLSSPDFTVDSVRYIVSNGSFQQFVYSMSQGYLGPGQSVQTAITVDGSVVKPEPESMGLSALGLVLILYLGHQSSARARHVRFGRGFGTSERAGE